MRAGGSPPVPPGAQQAPPVQSAARSRPSCRHPPPRGGKVEIIEQDPGQGEREIITKRNSKTARWRRFASARSRCRRRAEEGDCRHHPEIWWDAVDELTGCCQRGKELGYKVTDEQFSAYSTTSARRTSSNRRTVQRRPQAGRHHIEQLPKKPREADGDQPVQQVEVAGKVASSESEAQAVLRRTQGRVHDGPRPSPCVNSWWP